MHSTLDYAGNGCLDLVRNLQKSCCLECHTTAACHPHIGPSPSRGGNRHVTGCIARKASFRDPAPNDLSDDLYLTNERLV